MVDNVLDIVCGQLHSPVGSAQDRNYFVDTFSSDLSARANDARGDALLHVELSRAVVFMGTSPSDV